MNKLRIVGQWLWLNKERMFLVVMIAILIWRVVLVLNPAKQPDKVFSPPGSDVAKIAADKKPGDPSVAPELPPPADWSSIWKRNPFTVYSETAQGKGKDGEGASASIDLLQIQKSGPDGRPSVLLKYGNTSKWHKAGDSFVSYKLSSIDVDANTCEVYSEKEGRYVTLKIGK